jgi:hypothetical protein
VRSATARVVELEDRRDLRAVEILDDERELGAPLDADVVPGEAVAASERCVRRPCEDGARTSAVGRSGGRRRGTRSDLGVSPRVLAEAPADAPPPDATATAATVRSPT